MKASPTPSEGGAFVEERNKKYEIKNLAYLAAAVKPETSNKKLETSNQNSYVKTKNIK